MDLDGLENGLRACAWRIRTCASTTWQQPPQYRSLDLQPQPVDDRAMLTNRSMSQQSAAADLVYKSKIPPP